MKAKNIKTGEVVEIIKVLLKDNEEITIQGENGEIHAHKGDFIIKFSDGHIGVVRKDNFPIFYVKVD